MSIDNMKNMVILKDLPSNIVEEAIVILKPNIKLKSLDMSQNNNIKNKRVKEENPKKHIISEAEMLISNYISKIENDKNNINHFLKLLFQLIRCTEQVSIILRKATHARQTVQLARLLVAIYRTELGQTYREILV